MRGFCGSGANNVSREREEKKTWHALGLRVACRFPVRVAVAWVAEVPNVDMQLAPPRRQGTVEKVPADARVFVCSTYGVVIEANLYSRLGSTGLL